MSHKPHSYFLDDLARLAGFGSRALAEHPGNHEHATNTILLELPKSPHRKSLKNSIPELIAQHDAYLAKAGTYHGKELGLKERCVIRFGPWIRYLSNSAKSFWLVWDGYRFVQDHGRCVPRLINTVCDQIHHELIALEKKEPHFRRSLRKEITAFERQDVRNKALKMLADDDRLVLEPHHLDTNTDLFNLEDITLNLMTGAVSAHSPQDLLTRIALIPVHDSQAPIDEEWQAFVGQISGDDPMIAETIQRLAGYSLLPRNERHQCVMLIGPGASGKSTLLNAFRHSLGDYAATGNIDMFSKGHRPGAARSDLARVKGSRLVCITEAAPGSHMDATLLKALTGGDPIAFRELYGSDREVELSFTPWLAMNEAPELDTADSGLRRRIVCLPFQHVCPMGQRDYELPTRLKSPAMRTAIWNWAYQGLRLYQADGKLVVSKRVEEFTDEIWRELDPLHGFLELMSVNDAQTQHSSSDWRGAYQRFAEANGLEPISAKQLARHLKLAGMRSYPTPRERGWRGRRLLDRPAPQIHAMPRRF